MSETPISSILSKSDYTIYATRLKRRNKRSKVGPSVQFNNDEANPKFFSNLLTHFYNDSEDERTNIATIENPAILNNFKPFEFEKSLAMADHIFVQKISQSKGNQFSETEGFETCTNLSQAKNKSQCCSISKSEENSQNDSHTITETELISCCHQAEKILENDDTNGRDSTVQTLTPKKKNSMALVNSILEDFSQSPLSKEQIITNFSWQYTPEFRLRRLPLKNYSRKQLKFKRVNLAQRFEEPDTRHSSEYGDNMSCCSSLSVQEDETFCENSNNQSIASTLNNTERLCENLLNLTEYFTQNELSQNFEDRQSSDDCQSSEKSDIVSNLHKISDLLGTILNLRLKYIKSVHDDSYDSSDDFKGFANVEYNLDNHIAEQNSVIANLNLAPDFDDCDVSFSKYLNLRKDNTSLDDWSDDNCDIFACINTENILQQSNIHMNNKEENNVVAVATSSKCANNDKTFVVPNVPVLNTAVGNFTGLKIVSTKQSEISKEDNILAAKILSDLPSVPDFTGKDQLPNCDNNGLDIDENIFENSEDDDWNRDCDLFLNFRTPRSSKENIVTKTQQKLSALLAVSLHEQDDSSTSKLVASGFATAAGKAVCITSKGRTAIQNLLNEFTDEINNNKSYEEELNDMKLNAYAKNHNLETEKSFLSFQKQLHKEEKLQTAKAEQFSAPTEQNSNNCQNEFYAESELIFEEDFRSTLIETKGPEAQTKPLFDSTQPDILEPKQQPNKSFNLANEISTRIQKNSMKKLLKESVDIPGENFSTGTRFIQNDFNTKADQQFNEDIRNPLLGKHIMKTDILNVEFQTANGKQVSISAKAKQTIENLLKESNTDVDIENDLKDIKMQLQIKNRDLKEKQNLYTQNNEDPVHPLLFEQRSSQSNQLNTDINKSFQTANGKKVSISAKAKQTVENLLKEFNTDVDIENDLKDIKMQLQIKNRDLKEKQNLYTKNNENPIQHLLFEKRNTQSKQLNTGMNKGFQTANGKEISISAHAKQTVEILLKELSSDLDIEACENNFEDFKAKVLEKNKSIKQKNVRQELGEDIVRQNLNENNALYEKSNQLNEDSTKFSLDEKQNIEMNLLNTSIDVGFQTAKGKPVSVSAKAKQAVENLFKALNTSLDVETSEKYLKDIKTNIQNKNKGRKAESITQTHHEPPSTLELSDNLTLKPPICKRKMSLDNSDIETCDKTPAVKIFKNDLQSSKSSLAEKSLKSPLTSVTRSIIVRKNLLSLTKKRKNKGNALNKPTEGIFEISKDTDDMHAGTSTPTKSMEPASETPNLKEFLCNASSTSTPRLNKPQSAAQTLEDSDLKPIIWQNDSSVCNKSDSNSLYVTKLSQTSSSNISFNSPKPTAKERIGRLKMYGKAPDVSPILIETNHNCRPSGLRRTRSMLKRLEN